jgi:hypothetical protein
MKKMTWFLLCLAVISITAIIGFVIMFAVIDQHQQTSITGSEIVPLENARTQAVSWFRIQTLRSPILKNDSRWLSSVIDPDPCIIYDINGDPLWYRFNILQDSETAGTITISGQKTLGGPLYDLNPDPNSVLGYDRIEHARDTLMHDFSGDEIQSLRYVWDDSYGLLIEGSLRNGTDGQNRRIFLKAYEYSIASPDIQNQYSSYGNLTGSQHQAMIMQWIEGDRSSKALQDFARVSNINLSGPITSYEGYAISEFLINNSIDAKKSLPPEIPGKEITPGVTGRPCRSTEEWHRRADEIGYWVDGFLIDESKSDDEISGILGEHNITGSVPVTIKTPHYIGYYIEIPETDYVSFLARMENARDLNASLSSGSYVFVNSSVKRNGDAFLVPVFISYSQQMDENATYSDLLKRGFAVKKTKVVTYDLFLGKTPEERTILLDELNNDPRILFVFKEYMEGVPC